MQHLVEGRPRLGSRGLVRTGQQRVRPAVAQVRRDGQLGAGGVEDSPGVGRRVGVGLAVDLDRWVVVHRERLLGAFRVHAQRSELGHVLELGDALEPERAVLQRVVVPQHRREAGREPFDAGPGALARHDDPIDAIERGEVPLDLLSGVRIERVQGLQLVLGDVRSEPQGQGIVPAVDAEHRAGRHVGGQPLGGLDTAVRSPVDAGDERHAPQCGQHRQRPAADEAGRTGPASGAEQRGEPDAGEHRQGGIDGQQIAHGRRPARGDDHEPAADPDRQQQQLSGAAAPADHRADQRSNGQCRSQAPQHQLLHRVHERGPADPLDRRGDISTCLQIAQSTQVVEPLLIQPPPVEGVRVRHAEDDHGERPGAEDPRDGPADRAGSSSRPHQGGDDHYDQDHRRLQPARRRRAGQRSGRQQPRHAAPPDVEQRGEDGGGDEHRGEGVGAEEVGLLDRQHGQGVRAGAEQRHPPPRDDPSDQPDHDDRRRIGERGQQAADEVGSVLGVESGGTVVVEQVDADPVESLDERLGHGGRQHRRHRLGREQRQRAVHERVAVAIRVERRRLGVEVLPDAVRCLDVVEHEAPMALVRMQVLTAIPVEVPDPGEQTDEGDERQRRDRAAACAHGEILTQRSVRDGAPLGQPSTA